MSISESAYIEMFGRWEANLAQAQRKRQPFDNTKRMLASIHLASCEIPPEQRRAAVRLVAGLARDAADCVELLEMLGLNPEEGL